MSVFTKHYCEAKKLGEKIGWTQSQINEHAVAEAQEEITNLTRELVDAFNSSYLREAEQAILEGINRSHRTLQAEFWAGMKNVMVKYSQQDKSVFFDGRNEHCRDMTRRMSKAAFDPDYDQQ